MIDGADLNHARVVDQDVDAGAGEGLVHELFDFFALAQVARRDFDLDAAADEILLRALELGAIAGGDRDAGAPASELASEQQSESTRSAGDQHRAAAEIDVRASRSPRQSTPRQSSGAGGDRLLF